MKLAFLVPVWGGIIVNVLFSAINVSLIGHYGPWAHRWIRYSPWLLGVLWAICLGWAFLLWRTP